jgi:PQQ-dependent catabolism-associated CXXCW motif protein
VRAARARGAVLAVAGVLFHLVPAVGEEPVVPEPAGYRTDDYRSPVPRTLRGARVIAVEEAEVLWRSGRALFIDVFPRAPKPANLPSGTIWRDVAHWTIGGAYWLPNVGYGVLSPAAEEYFHSRLARLAADAVGKPLVFLCQRNCWMSWNAAKRALAWGYPSVVWFPDGTDAWQEAGYDLVRVEPVP